MRTRSPCSDRPSAAGIDARYINMSACSEPLGFGGAPLGNLFAPIADAMPSRSSASACDRGIRYFDTAPHYGNGLSEHRIGAALRDCRATITCCRPRSAACCRRSNAPRDQHGYVDVLPFVAALGLLARRHAAQHRRQPAAPRPRAHRLRVHPRRRARRARRRAAAALSRRDGRRGAGAGARSRPRARSRGYGLGVNDWQVCVDALRARRPRRHPAGRALHAARPVGACRAAAAMRDARRARRARRAVQFRHPRHRHAARRRIAPLYFNYAPAPPRCRRARRGDRSGLRRASRCRSRPPRCNFRARIRRSPACCAGARTRRRVRRELRAWRRAPIPAAFWRDLRARAVADRRGGAAAVRRDAMTLP